MLELKNKKTDEVHVSEMEDGDIAIITKWEVKNYVGRVVQRYKNYLLTLGEDSGSGWGKFFNNKGMNNNYDDYVRILKKGEILIVGEKL